MGDHYIPQCYLRGFAERPECRTTYMFQKGSADHIRTNLRNVAQQTKLYSRELEAFFANSIEAPTKPVLDKIIAQQSITEAERSIFVTFVVAMWRRVPSHKDVVGKWLEETAESYYVQLESEIKHLRELHPGKRDILNNRMLELHALRKENRITPERIWFQLLQSGPSPKVSWAISNMSWQFLITDGDEFLTSDNPVFFFKSLGVGHMNSEVTFPVSSKIALFATWQSNVHHGYRPATGQQIQEINRRTSSAAIKYLFFPRTRDWIPKLANTSQPKLHQLTKDPSDARLVHMPGS
ncbi:MAG: DUF4238 domain-containing protein [Ignavibacteria bacterium]|nr:DUF4238 domain-containing protein [Ignavibacteria bacterium]